MSRFRTEDFRTHTQLTCVHHTECPLRCAHSAQSADASAFSVCSCNNGHFYDFSPNEACPIDGLLARVLC